MPGKKSGTSRASLDPLPFDDSHYRDLTNKHIFRLLLTYLAPLLLLIVYFYIQYNALADEGRRMHLQAIAENMSNTLDLFINERIVNLSNIIDDPKFPTPPSTELIESYLTKLKTNSESFVDIGFLDSSGIQTAYEGPYPSLEKQDYSSEKWYRELIKSEGQFIITDLYLGFRQEPHFTIAVTRQKNDRNVVLRATLAPEKVYDYMRSLEGANEVSISIVNDDGYYQVVTPNAGSVLEKTGVIPPKKPKIGTDNFKVAGQDYEYTYSWLKTADWALIVQGTTSQSHGLFSGFRLKIVIIAAAIVLLTTVVIITRAKKLVELQKETDQTRAQLEHAAKLASVGELAAGIAHEINNPLAVINEEAGLMKDILNPDFDLDASPESLGEHLDTIQKMVFRCRDITHKLLGFVRKSEMDLKSNDINELLNSVVDGLLGPELNVSNIEIIRVYDKSLPEIVTDGNQLQQVFLNIVNNGMDACEEKPGKIILKTARDHDFVVIEISDTGKGMSKEQLEKIFLPFYTTKEVGKGTGLGLSVSYGIIKNLGGKIEVESEVGEGSTFRIYLPIDRDKI